MKNEFKKILEIGVPSTIAWMGHILYNIIDNFMIGKMLGSESLAISGISTSVYMIFLILGMGISSILTAMISESVAVKNSKQTAKIFQNGLFVCTLFGIALFVILFFGGSTIIYYVNNQPHLNERIFSYLDTLSFAPIPIMIFFAFERLSEGMNRAKISMYTVLICNISNIFLNYGLIGGNLGLPNMGINGAALSSVINNCFEVIIVVFLSKKDAILRKVITFKMEYFSPKLMMSITTLGIPGGLLFFLEGTAFNIANFIASKSSINDVAAHQLLMGIVTSVLIPIFGFSTALTARIAYNVKLKKEKLAFQIGLYGFYFTALYMVIIMILLFIFKIDILNVMLKGGENDLVTINLVVSTLFMMIFIEIFDGIQVIGGGILRGYKDTKIPAIFALLSYWGICIPLGYFFAIPKEMGIYGIWLGISVGILVQAALFFARFQMKYKPKKLIEIKIA
jgi:MATE family multidrug resistance protein